MKKETCWTDQRLFKALCFRLFSVRSMNKRWQKNRLKNWKNIYKNWKKFSHFFFFFFYVFHLIYKEQYRLIKEKLCINNWYIYNERQQQQQQQQHRLKLACLLLRTYNALNERCAPEVVVRLNKASYIAHHHQQKQHRAYGFCCPIPSSSCFSWSSSCCCLHNQLFQSSTSNYLLQ